VTPLLDYITLRLEPTVAEIPITNFEGVYKPAEDSLLLINHLPDVDSPILEIGSGTGIVSVSLAIKGHKVTAVDLNPKAVEATKWNSENNGVEIEVLEGDMFSPIGERKFATIVCNPPYLPYAEEYRDSDLELAVEGGINGSEFTQKLLSEAEKHLTSNGSIYMIQSSKMAAFKTKWQSKVIEQISFFFERITLVRFYF